MNTLRFGTDGVRGVAGSELTPEFAVRLGRAAARQIDDVDPTLPIVVGRDTRLSGPMLEQAFIAGVVSAGRPVATLGIVPTPTIAFVTKFLGAAAGVVISASHNPIEDNGFKFFDHEGFKFSDAREAQVSQAYLRDDAVRAVGTAVGAVTDIRSSIDAYVAAMVRVGADLRGYTVVVDGAFGAAYSLAPKILTALGAYVVPLHCEADGSRINVGCGATDLTALAAHVRELSADGSRVVGVAFDGDADRARFVDERGETVDGDAILYLLARDLDSRGQLAQRTLVGTVMCNAGFEQALRLANITLERAPVGDRYVLDRMRKHGYVLGGEPSGHVVDLRVGTTGDGIATAISLFGILSRADVSLASATQPVTLWPQILVNVRVKQAFSIDDDAGVTNAIAKARARLQAQGRILVRPSGTEPIIRVMVEGPDATDVNEIAHTVAGTIREAALRRASEVA